MMSPRRCTPGVWAALAVLLPGTTFTPPVRGQEPVDAARANRILQQPSSAAGPGAGSTLTLLEAADSALATHPALGAARARMGRAEAGLDAARARRIPTVAGTSGLTRFEEPMVVAPLHGFDLTSPPDFDRTLVQSRLGVQYTLFDGGARGARIRGAGALTDAAASARDAAEMDLLEAIAQAYLGLASAREVRIAADHQVAALDSEHSRAQQRFDQGTAARVEVLRAEAALQDARAQEASAASRVTLAAHSLARLMGVDPGWIETHDLTPPADVPVSNPEPSHTVPRVEAARRNVAAAQARLEQERAGRLPSLQATGGLVNFGSGNGHFVTEWQGGVQLSWPLFTGGARTAAIRAAEADLATAREELRLAELEASAAVDAAEAGLVETRARRDALNASVRRWEEVARIEALSLEAGSGVQTDFLRAQAGLFRARAGLARARNDQILARVRFAHARGQLDRSWIQDALEARS